MTESRQSGGDIAADFQRWLLRSGARGVSRELGGHLRSAFGRGGEARDVWQNATAPPREAPECAWCPVCRAARVLRVSGPGLASQVAAASDLLGTMVQDAMSLVESAMAAAREETAAGRPGQEEETAAPSPADAWPSGDAGADWPVGEVGEPWAAAGVDSPGTEPAGEGADGEGEPAREVRATRRRTGGPARGERPGASGSPEGPSREPDDRG